MQNAILKFGITVLAGIMLSTGLAARDESGNDPKKKTEKKDTTISAGIEERGFKDLFTGEVNTSEPYTTQINPRAWSFVQDYLARYGKQLENMKSWAGPYFRMMDAILTSYGIPREMKYLAVIESNLRNTALSWAGAVGPWQFMPETGRRMGLRIDYRVDERTDYLKSTHAAARYLKELYRQYGDWLLVIAAYNGGPGRVESAIRRSGTRNFWDLQYHLPEESRTHVKKFIGTHYIMEGSGGQTTSTKEEWVNTQRNTFEQANTLRSNLTPEDIANTVTATIIGRYNSVVTSTHLSMDISEFNRLNPHFDKLVNVDSGYLIRLPPLKMELFNVNRHIILYQSILATMHNARDAAGGFPASPAAKPKGTSVGPAKN